MKLFDVYSLFPIEPVRAQGYYLWDKTEKKYLDFYGGHAVISIGHSHPHYIETISKQLDKLGFYSNSIQNPLQVELAEKLGALSGYEDYSLFLCNSGAEANENALKIASFTTERSKVLAFKHSFHGRTSGAVAATDNPKIVSPFNAGHQITFVELGDIESVAKELSSSEYSAVIIEGIQGVAGIITPEKEFLTELSQLCKQYRTLLILDEVQSGYGRSGKFFAHQHADIKADIITTAKGMANGFPIGGVLVSPEIDAWYGMLGTTFGGNHLACAAAIAVLDVIKAESLIENSKEIGKYLFLEIEKIASTAKGKEIIKEVRGTGLMIGIELYEGYKQLRQKLLFEENIFTGAAGANIIRLLPPLCIDKTAVDIFINSFSKIVQEL